MNAWQSLSASQPKQVRRTFFSFHYQQDVSRAQVVRNSWVTKEDREAAGFFDGSVFESKKRAGEETLKAFLTDALKGTTVTCILIGNQTAFRPWVRYELVRSFHRGNGLLGIYIHNVRNLDKQTTVAGPNPFEQMAFRVVDGRISWLEVNNGNWTVYDRVPTMAQSEAAYDLGGRTNHTFGTLFRTYDWVNDNGYPDRVTTRLVGVATARLQTPACVNRTCRALHPHGHVWLWSESRRGICDTYHSPALDKTDLLHFNNRRFPLARIRGRIKTHEIEFQDYSTVSDRWITLKSLSRTWRASLPAPRSTGHEPDGW